METEPLLDIDSVDSLNRWFPPRQQQPVLIALAILFGLVTLASYYIVNLPNAVLRAVDVIAETALGTSIVALSRPRLPEELLTVISSAEIYRWLRSNARRNTVVTLSISAGASLIAFLLFITSSGVTALTESPSVFWVNIGSNLSVLAAYLILSIELVSWVTLRLYDRHLINTALILLLFSVFKILLSLAAHASIETLLLEPGPVDVNEPWYLLVLPLASGIQVVICLGLALLLCKKSLKPPDRFTEQLSEVAN
jgi:hypothetical protein